MSSVGKLHHKAMSFAERASVARLQGNDEEAARLFKYAYEFEAQAARALKNDFENEPTRSVLHRSAASLAYECGELREAERLIASGILGNPPDEIADELRRLLKQVNFEQFLETAGVALQSNEVEISIAGQQTGWGIAPSEIVLDRLQNFKKLVERTVERLNHRPYREGGASTASKSYPLFLKAFAPGSFSVTLTVGHPLQMRLPVFENLDPATDVIKEILDCIELLNDEEEEKLKERITEPAYFNNFVGLMNKIAPDGKAVSGVKFTSLQDDESRKVALTRRQETISQIPKIATEPDSEKGEPVRVKGVLRFADALKVDDTGAIKLLGEDNKIYTVIVPVGMDDIVGPLWYQTVVVTGTRIHKKIYLKHIDKVE